MKIEIETKKLNYILKKISQVSYSFYAKPEWNGILITVYEDKMEFEVKNDFLALKETLYSDKNILNINKSGKVLVKNKLLIEIIARITDQKINIYTIDENILLIKSDNFSYELNLMDEREFENSQFNLSAGESLEIKFKELHELLTKVIFAGDERAPRKILQGINLIVKDGEIKAFASDNVRIAFYKKNISNKNINFNKIIPIKVIKEFLKIFNFDENININFFLNHFTITTENTIMQANLIEGKFPNLENIFPEKFKNTLRIEKREIARLLEGSTILNSNKESNSNIIKLILEENTLNVEFREVEIGYSNVKTKNFEFDGDPNFFISFNPKLFLEALRVIENNKIKVVFNEHDQPFVVYDQKNFKCLILPFKI